MRRRCADMTDAQLRAFLETLGNDLGLELLDRSELVDLASASALSSGRTPDPSTTRRRGAGDVARRRAAQTSLRASLADSMADRADEIVTEASAARMGRGEALEGMIRRGEVGPNARDGNSECDFALLHVAAVNGNRGVCRRLLALGADTSAVDARGRTALDLALRYNHSALADYLRLKGARYGGDEATPPSRVRIPSRAEWKGRTSRATRRWRGIMGGVPRGTEGGATRDELGARRAGDVRGGRRSGAGDVETR